MLSLLSDSQGIVLYGSADKRALIQVVALGWYSIESQFKWYSIAVLIKYIPFKAYGSANKRKPVCITDISSTDKESWFKDDAAVLIQASSTNKRKPEPVQG